MPCLHINILIALCLFVPCATAAQTLPIMKQVPAGNFIAGGGYQYQIIGSRMHLIGEDSTYARLNAQSPVIGEVPWQNNPERKVSVSAFEIAEHETSNQEYRDFLIDSLLSPEEQATLRTRLKRIKAGIKTDSSQAAYAVLFERAATAQLLPDQECWTSGHMGVMMNPYVEYYFSHPAFAPYPVVGVSWHQANAYCAWLSTKVNKALAAKGEALKPDFRLPTEMEWEYAAQGNPGSEQKRIYPWPGWSYYGIKVTFMANVKNGPGDYASDGYMATSPVKSFPKNGLELYDMAGNVSEWTLDVFRFHKDRQDAEAPTNRNEPRLVEAAPEMLVIQERVIKGGSWADYYYAAMCGSRAGMDETRGYSRVGFRVARSVLGQAKEF